MGIALQRQAGQRLGLHQNLVGGLHARAHGLGQDRARGQRIGIGCVGGHRDPRGLGIAPVIEGLAGSAARRQGVFAMGEPRDETRSQKAEQEMTHLRQNSAELKPRPALSGRLCNTDA